MLFGRARFPVSLRFFRMSVCLRYNAAEVPIDSESTSA